MGGLPHSNLGTWAVSKLGLYHPPGPQSPYQPSASGRKRGGGKLHRVFHKSGLPSTFHCHMVLYGCAGGWVMGSLVGRTAASPKHVSLWKRGMNL